MGDPVVLLHGLGITSDFWRPNIPDLADAGYHVYTLDLPGFGKSDVPGGIYSVGFFADVVNEFIEQKELDQIILVGHSLGGAIAICFASTFPEKVRALVLSDTFGVGNGFLPTSLDFFTDLVIPSIIFRASDQTQRVIDLILDLNFYDRSKLPAELIDLTMSGSWTKGYRGRLKTSLGAAISLGTAFQRKRFLSQFQLCHKNHHIPVLILWGEEDRLFPVSDAYRLEAALPGSSLHIFAKCGHVPSLEMVSQFDDVLIHFLKESLPQRS